jgi:hypothetical protein
MLPVQDLFSRKGAKSCSRKDAKGMFTLPKLREARRRKVCLNATDARQVYISFIRESMAKFKSDSYRDTTRTSPGSFHKKKYGVLFYHNIF